MKFLRSGLNRSRTYMYNDFILIDFLNKRLTGDGGGEYVILDMGVELDFKALVARFFSFSFCSASL